MRNLRGRLWFTVVSFVFMSFVVTAVIMSIFFIAGMRFDFISTPGPIGTMSVVAFAIASIIIGTIISSIFSRIITKPIKKLSNAMKRVSTGDFTVQVEKPDNDSELYDLIRDFNKMVRELGSIETLRNDFIANVSHEFKTPIASIEGCATLLQDRSLTEEERVEYARLIAESAQKLSVMISNILSLTRLENQEFTGEQKTFSLDEQIRSAILMLEQQWSAKNIELDIELAPVRIFNNEAMLLQVWLNLIGNAVKFSDDGGRVSVRLSEKGEEAIIIVADNGIGMTEDVVNHIFGKFYQGDKSRSKQGNGLGLSLVKKILDMTGGKISVASMPGQGSVFTVTLINKKDSGSVPYPKLEK